MCYSFMTPELQVMLYYACALGNNSVITIAGNFATYAGIYFEFVCIAWGGVATLRLTTQFFSTFRCLQSLIEKLPSHEPKRFGVSTFL